MKTFQPNADTFIKQAFKAYAELASTDIAQNLTELPSLEVSRNLNELSDFRSFVQAAIAGPEMAYTAMIEMFGIGVYAERLRAEAEATGKANVKKVTKKADPQQQSAFMQDFQPKGLYDNEKTAAPEVESHGEGVFSVALTSLDDLPAVMKTIEQSITNLIQEDLKEGRN